MSNPIVRLKDLKAEIENNSTMDISVIEYYASEIDDIIKSINESVCCIEIEEGETCDNCQALKFADSYM